MKKRLLTIGAGALLFVCALLISNKFELIGFILFLSAFIVSGADVIKNAVKGISRGNIFNENTLMVVAAIGAFFIKEYPEAVFVMLFYRVGEAFEDYAVKKSRKSISDVMNICPDYANLLVDGVVKQVDPDDVEIGDVIVIAPGERVPLDGIVIEGSSFIDTSALTGESVPRAIKENDEILSGCINKNAPLKVKVTKSFENSTVSRILELVETAAARKSSSERFISKFAKYYTPTVLVCALLLAVLPPLLIEGASFSDYVYRALSFLVVSCPCALVISVPLAFFGGIGGAAKEGILIKGGAYLEALANVDTAVFDKTGTLTLGVFTITEINSTSMSKDELLELAAYAENVATHPIADSIRNSYGRKIDLDRISKSEEISGKGVYARVDGRDIYVGNSKLMQMLGIECSSSKGTEVHVAVDGSYSGYILISDKLKPDTKAAISNLKKSGINKTYMLTGDVNKTAIIISSEAGIDEVRSDLLPGEKVNELEKIMSITKKNVFYVGDGINDAPVLARADVGIAMGALGSDAAIEASDVVIMTDELSKIEKALKLSKKTMRIAKQNIVFSIAIKVGILILCSLNIVGMGIAVFGDVGVMVLAVLNSFRALKS